VANWDIGNVLDMTDMLSGTGLTTKMYSDLLVNWGALSTLQSNVPFGVGSTTYVGHTASTSRQSLIADNGWTITDDGQVNLSPVLSSHAAGQVSEMRGNLTTDMHDLLVFKIELDETFAPHTDFILDTVDIRVVSDRSIDFDTIELYEDVDNSGDYDELDTLVATGTYNAIDEKITLNTDEIISTLTNYVLRAEPASLPPGATLEFTILPTHLTAQGAIFVGESIEINHRRNVRTRSGGGGGIVVTGGGVASGGRMNPEEGDNIVMNVGYVIPTLHGQTASEWLNANNAMLSNNTFATTDSNLAEQSFSGFNFQVPATNEITGITVKVDAATIQNATATIGIALSKDAGQTFTNFVTTDYLSETDGVYTLGGESVEWGTTWLPADVTSENFVVHVQSNITGSSTVYLDGIAVLIHHQATGGGGGGGGGRF